MLLIPDLEMKKHTSSNIVLPQEELPAEESGDSFCTSYHSTDSEEEKLFSAEIKRFVKNALPVTLAISQRYVATALRSYPDEKGKALDLSPILHSMAVKEETAPSYSTQTIIAQLARKEPVFENLLSHFK